MGRCAALYPLYICEKTMRARVGQQNTCVLLCSHGRTSCQRDGRFSGWEATRQRSNPRFCWCRTRVKKGHSLCYLTGNVWSTDGCSMIRGRRRTLDVSGTSWIAWACGLLSTLRKRKLLSFVSNLGAGHSPKGRGFSFVFSWVCHKRRNTSVFVMNIQKVRD